jgi:hypothetical protein
MDDYILNDKLFSNRWTSDFTIFNFCNVNFVMFLVLVKWNIDLCHVMLSYINLTYTVKWDSFIEYTNKLYILWHCINVVFITAEKVHINRWVIIYFLLKIELYNYPLFAPIYIFFYLYTRWNYPISQFLSLVHINFISLDTALIVNKNLNRKLNDFMISYFLIDEHQILQFSITMVNMGKR